MSKVTFLIGPLDLLGVFFFRTVPDLNLTILTNNNFNLISDFSQM